MSRGNSIDVVHAFWDEGGKLLNSVERASWERHQRLTA
jgi:hypothetical protein